MKCNAIVYLKLESHVVCQVDRVLVCLTGFDGAVAAGESISLRSLVSSHLTCSVGGSDVDREGQRLQLCMLCKCNAKSNSHNVKTYNTPYAAYSTNRRRGK